MTRAVMNRKVPSKAGVAEFLIEEGINLLNDLHK